MAVYYIIYKNSCVKEFYVSLNFILLQKFEETKVSKVVFNYVLNSFAMTRNRNMYNYIKELFLRKICIHTYAERKENLNNYV